MSEPSESEVVRLLREVKQGDRAARAKLFSLLGDEAHFGKVIRSLAHSVLPKDHRARRLLDSGDLTQSALRTGLEKISLFRGETENELFGWFAKILRTKVNRVSRRKEFRQPSAWLVESPADGRPPPEADVIDNEAIATLHKAVKKLPLSMRVVVALRLEEKTSAQIAAILGLKEDAVRQRECRALALLRKLTGEPSGEGEAP